jgi:integrase
MERLTQKRIDQAIRARDGQLARGIPYVRQLLRDPEVRGFTAIIHGESVAYQFGYKPRGTDPTTGRRFSSRYIRIGDSGTHALQEARDAARRLRLRVQLGEDPKAAELRTRDAARVASRQRITCDQRLAAYEKALQSRGRSVKYRGEELGNTRLTLTQGRLADLTPEEITPQLVELALAACSASARRARFGSLDRFLRWALKGTGFTPATSNFDAFEKPAAPAARSRVLSGGEIAAIWKAADRAPSAIAADLTRFLITVPCRRGEAAIMKWSDVDLAGRVWTMPTSKNSDPHSFPLNDRAILVLLRRRQDDPTEHVFPCVGGADAPFNAWNDLIDNLREYAAIADWRLHDLRRSFVTLLAEAGTDETLLDLIINHRASKSRSGVKGIYQRAERWAERVKALHDWNLFLDQQLGENVAPLRRGRGRQ